MAASAKAGPPGLPWSSAATWLKLAAVAVAYYVAAQVGLAFALSQSVASPVWPPTGLAIAAVVILGYRALPGIAAGVFLAEASAGVPLPWILLMVAGTNLEAAIGGWILRRAGGVRTFDRLAGIPWHAAASLLAPLPAAVLGVAALVGSGIVPASAAGAVAVTWYFGDVGGAVLLAPAILLSWRAARPPWPAVRADRLAEACAAVVALAGTAIAVFILGAPFAYLYVAPIIWIALRIGPTATALSLVALDAVAVLATRAGHGPFAAATANRSLLLLQGFVVGVNLLSFAVASLSTERLRVATQLELRVAERTRQLQELNDRLRHEAAERLLAQAQVDEAQHVARMGTWRWDVSKPHADWSPELYRIYGLDPRTHTPSYEDYLTRIHPDDVERVKTATEAVFRDHKPYSHDERVRRPDGSWRTLHTWAQAALDADGKLVALVGACQDVTEEKLAEAALQESLERFRALAESSPIGIVHTTPEGSVDYANQAWSQITGIVEFRDDDAVRRAIHPDDQPRSWRLWNDALSRGTQWADEMRWVRPDGSVRLTSCRAVPVRSSTGRITGFVSTVEDITEQRAAEERDREVRRLQEQADFKTNFLRTAAHELGTPLTPILLQIRVLRGLLESKRLEPETHALDVLERNLQRLRVLVGDLLESARLQSGRMRLNVRPADLSHLAHEAVETFQGPAIERGIALDLQGPPTMPVHADPDRVAQVLYNLLSNAMKFSSPGGQVHVRLEPEDEDKARITVQDTGAGFAAERAAQLFQPFSQLHDAMQGFGGSGLGLYISRGIVEEHGGHISAQSDGPGRGATFTCTLPLRAAARIHPHGPDTLSVQAPRPPAAPQPPAAASGPPPDASAILGAPTGGAAASPARPKAR